MTRFFLALPLILSSITVAQDDFAWAENIGWINFSPTSDDPLAGMVVENGYLSGYVWAENVGWISLGLHSPGEGQYGNLDGDSHGVNFDPANGDLLGLAWGENIGWINFDTRAALSSQGLQARVGYDRLYGFAWGENVGWINMDTSEGMDEPYVSIPCPADQTRDGVHDFSDVVTFLSRFSQQSPLVDTDDNGVFDFTDVLEFLSDFAAGCL